MTARRRFSAQEKQAAVQHVRDTGRLVKDVAAELGINPRTLTQWVRVDRVERRGQAWERRVRPHFGFLANHGFRLDTVCAENWWAVTVLYRSSVSAVEVTLSFEYQRVELSLLRLVDGALPKYPIFIVDSVPINTFQADWLLKLRAGSTPQPGHGLDDAGVEAQLGYWAAVLRDQADFLDGDLAVLDQLEELIRDNARRHGPPEMTVWVPQDAHPDAAVRVVDQVQATTPGEVAVTMRRYRR